MRGILKNKPDANEYFENYSKGISKYYVQLDNYGLSASISYRLLQWSDSILIYP